MPTWLRLALSALLAGPLLLGLLVEVVFTDPPSRYRPGRR